MEQFGLLKIGAQLPSRKRPADRAQSIVEDQPTRKTNRSHRSKEQPSKGMAMEIIENHMSRSSGGPLQKGEDLLIAEMVQHQGRGDQIIVGGIDLLPSSSLKAQVLRVGVARGHLYSFLSQIDSHHLCLGIAPC